MAAFHEVLEMIKTCAGRREKNDITGMREVSCSLHQIWILLIVIDWNRIFDATALAGIQKSRLDFRRSFSGKEQNLHMIQNRIAEIIIRNPLVFAAADQDDLLRKDGEGSHRAIRTGVDGTVIILDAIQRANEL